MICDFPLCEGNALANCWRYTWGFQMPCYAIREVREWRKREKEAQNLMGPMVFLTDDVCWSLNVIFTLRACSVPPGNFLSLQRTFRFFISYSLVCPTAPIPVSGVTLWVGRGSREYERGCKCFVHTSGNLQGWVIPRPHFHHNFARGYPLLFLW